MCILGVDAGGTKCEFMLVDGDGKTLTNFEIQESCNLKYVRANKIIQTLDQGLQKIFVDYPPEIIKFAYFGVAECGDGIGSEQNKIRNYLEKYFQKYELADDQYSCFRSLSDSKSGVLAIAGTGTALSYFSPKEEKIFKSIGKGGRDFGKVIFSGIISGSISPKNEIYKTLKQCLGTDPKDFYQSLRGYDLVVHPQIAKVAKILVDESKNNPILEREVNLYLDVAAARWVTKICSYCFTHFHYKEESRFDLVLIGSFWKADYLRKKVEEELKHCFPKIKVLYDTSIHPVEGCIKIARGKLQKRSSKTQKIAV